MKKGYVKPVIEVEEFALNAAIAAGCDITVTLGPDSVPVCTEYEQEVYSLRSSTPIETPFSDENSCSCYLSSVGGTLTTS